MKQSVLHRPLPNQSLPRNAFDRGFETKVNFNSGQLIPVFCQPVLGGSNMRINRQLVLRAAQVETASFARMNVNVDFYFVPFRQMYSFYGSKRTNVNDLHSSLLNARFNEHDKNADLPLFDLQDVWNDFVGTELRYGDVAREHDEFGFQKVSNAFRLLDLLDYGVNFSFFSVTGLQGDSLERVHTRFVCLPAQNPFRLLAYQKVWFDHYRMSNYFANDPEAYNVDSSFSGDNITVARCKKMLTLRYAPYRKDYFTNIYPSLNYASSGIQPFDSVVPSQVFSVNSSSFRPQIVTEVVPSVGDYASPAVSMSSVTGTGNAAFSAQTIRALFALDKLTRLAAYAPKHVADQFEARFGFRPYAEDINESVRIGSFTSDLAISEVLNMAESDSASLGALGGRGFSVDGFQRDIEYQAKEDGIVIGVAYVLPRMSYDSGGVDAFNSLISLNDFPQYEFMNLGLSPIRRKELYFISDYTEGTQVERITENNNEILGYQPMYSNWKIGVDRNHGLFINGKILAPFATHTKSRWTDLTDEGRFDQSFIDPLDGTFFYCSPRDLNPVFAQEVTSDPITDQFFALFNFKFDVVQNMSVHGQPSI